MFPWEYLQTPLAYKGAYFLALLASSDLHSRSVPSFIFECGICEIPVLVEEWKAKANPVQKNKLVQ